MWLGDGNAGLAATLSQTEAVTEKQKFLGELWLKQIKRQALKSNQQINITS